MKNKNKLHSLALASAAVVLFLILVSSTASASITEKRITTNLSNSEFPDIYSNKIVWQDNRNGNWDIYIYDLSTKNEIHTNNLSDQISPAIYENNVVWADSRDGPGSEIYLQNLSTKVQTRITTTAAPWDPDFGTALGPDIYGNKIAWVDGRNTDHAFMDIYLYDISKKTETELPITATSGELPAIYNDRVVYFDGYLPFTIYLYNLSSKQETTITSGETQVLYPKIYGNRIVWQDSRNGNWDIYMYDLSTKKETRITTNASDSENPVIYGNSIVWQDNRSGNWDIYMYDLVTGQQIHTTDKSDQVDPAIYSNKVVWTDYRNGNPDIYMGTISYLPVAAFTASPTSGKAPLTVKFTDKSTDAYYWSWNFGDKTTSTAQNPVHKYSTVGKYTVTLTVKNAAGSNTKTASSLITVS